MHTSTFYIPSDFAVDDSTLTVPFSVLFRPFADVKAKFMIIIVMHFLS